MSDGQLDRSTLILNGSLFVCVCVCVNKIVDNSEQKIVSNELLKTTLENV